jgi:hypothetical protein
MDFHDQNIKKRRTRRLLFTYVLIALAIATGTLALGLESFGYHLNPKTGELGRDGLVFLSSRPGGADIYLNGERKNQQTAARLILPAGDYAIELREEGYRSWHRDISLKGGSIERLVYPVLFPQELEARDVQLYGKLPELATQSPDRRWLVVLKPESLTQFDVFDLNSDRAASRAISLPEGVLSASEQSHKLTLVEWSSDNRRVLLSHTYGKQREFIMLDREEPRKSFNVNKLFGTSPDQVALRDKRFDRLYLYNSVSKTLSTADVGAVSTKTLLNRVLAFKPHEDDRLLYITDKSAGLGKVNANLLDGENSRTIKRLDSSERYFLDLARFDGRWYVAVGSSKENRTYLFKNPLQALHDRPYHPLEPESVLGIDNATGLSFSANARFIALQGGSQFAVYDMETKRRHSYKLDIPVAADQKATWMDGHRLSVLSSGKLTIFDYDGINLQTLAPMSGFQPFFDREYTALHTIAPSKTVSSRPALLRTELQTK